MQGIAHEKVRAILAAGLEAACADADIELTGVIEDVFEDYLHVASDMKREAQIVLGQIAFKHPEVVR